jgi:hypothetical protein
MSGPDRSRGLYVPRPVEVQAGADAVPTAVAGVGVEAVREEWRLEDRWWTARPLHRHYFELVLADGRDIVVFREGRRWYRQRA